MTKTKRVVITGIGWATSLGCDIESVWSSLLEGESGIKKISHIDTENLRTKICGLVSNFDDQMFSAKDNRKMDPFIRYALYSAEKAIKHANLPLEEIASDTGVAVGSGIGGLTYIEQNCKTVSESSPRRISPYFIPSTIINMCAGNISIKYGFKGPNISVVTACTTGTHNIGMAARMIASGDAKVMLAGGSEFASNVSGIGGFAAMKALSTRNDEPTKASRPFDKDRDGFVLSDGAGILILEDYDYATARGANIIAEVVGFKMTSDAYHMTSPDEKAVGAIACMQGAIDDAAISAEDISVINAHGTSTPANDRIETYAIKNVFGKYAYKLKVNSTKSMLGHSLGATGAIEAIVCSLTLRDQIIHPTINCENPDIDSGCDLDYVTNGSEKHEVNYIMSNSFGFGGTNGTLILKKYS